MNAEIKIIGLVGKQLKKGEIKKQKLYKKIVKTVESFGYKPIFDEYTGKALHKKHFLNQEEVLKKSDLVVTIGGDGTVLRTARGIRSGSIKLLAINIGKLGFLTEIHPKDLGQALKKIKAGQYKLEERFLISAKVYRHKKCILEGLALNDAVINQGPFARLLTLTVKINHQRAVTFRADGIIIATPTGSTGHSLSAGGPVVHPKIDAIVINPLCPVLLALRPMIIPGTSTIMVKIADKQGQKTEVRLTLDGQASHALEHGDEVHIEKARHHIEFIRLMNRTHYQHMEEKLRWREKAERI